MGSDSNESAAQNKDDSQKSKLSLYSQLGEESGINLFVEQFYHAMLAEPLLHPLFEQSELAALKAEQKEFVAIILGGRPPLDYWDIITSDPPPYLTLEHTDLMIEYAEAVLLNMGLEDSTVKNIIRVLSPFIEAFICGSTKADAKPDFAAQPEEIPGRAEEPELQDEHAAIEMEEVVTEAMEASSVEEEQVQEQRPGESFLAGAESQEESENARKFRELIEGKLHQKTQRPVLQENEGEFVRSEIPPAIPEKPTETESAPGNLPEPENSPVRLTTEGMVSALGVLLSELEKASDGDLTAEISV